GIVREGWPGHRCEVQKRWARVAARALRSGVDPERYLLRAAVRMLCILAAAAFCLVGTMWLEVSRVSVMLLWPSISWTTFGCSPAWSSKYHGELVDDGAELRVLFDIFNFEFDPGDPRIPKEWAARIELRNNEVGAGAVRVALYLAPGDRPDGLRFAEQAVVVHRDTKHVHERFADAIQFAARELQGMIVHLQEFAALNVQYPETVLAALRRRWELPEYLGEAILRAFQAMPGRTGAYLIWALLEAPKHLPADRAIPYELQLQLYDIAAWLATKA